MNSTRKGDLLVRMRVWTPTKLSAEEKRLLEQLGEIQRDMPPPEKGLFDRIKETFGG